MHFLLAIKKHSISDSSPETARASTLDEFHYPKNTHRFLTHMHRSIILLIGTVQRYRIVWKRKQMFLHKLLIGLTCSSLIQNNSIRLPKAGYFSPKHFTATILLTCTKKRQVVMQIMLVCMKSIGSIQNEAFLIAEQNFLPIPMIPSNMISYPIQMTLCMIFT